MIVKVCAACSPQNVEEYTKYFGHGECQACGAQGELRGHGLRQILEVLARIAVAAKPAPSTEAKPLHGDCVCCLARANGISAVHQTLVLLKTLETVSPLEMRADLCFEHVRRLGPTVVA